MSMSDSDLRQTADRRLTRAIEETGFPDPRPLCRDRLRDLRESNPAAFRQAVEYFENTLIPEVAREGTDPLAEWVEYGRFLAALRVAGETVQIDATGRRSPYARPFALGSLVLHLPTSVREPALLVALPPEPSPAQRATHDLLVLRKVG